MTKLRKLCFFTLASAMLLLGVVGPVVITGCTTTQQRVTFNTLYSIEHSTVSAYDAYTSQVIAGAVATNGVPQVSKAFNTFQASFVVALDAAQYNTNALAPANLVIEAQDVVNAIQQFSGK